jgi:hypothetical protein
MKRVLRKSFKEDPLERILRLLDHVDSKELLILKSHCLVEEQLQRIIEARLNDPTKLDRNNITFDLKLSLVEAIIGDSVASERKFLVEILKGIKLLKTLRNKFAHDPECDLQNDVQKLCDLFNAHNPEKTLKSAIGIIYGGISALANYFEKEKNTKYYRADMVHEFISDFYKNRKS